MTTTVFGCLGVGKTHLDKFVLAATVAMMTTVFGHRKLISACLDVYIGLIVSYLFFQPKLALIYLNMRLISGLFF
jgi:hypothetical protein